MKITNGYSFLKTSTQFVLIFGLLLAFSVSAFGQQITISRPGSSMDYESANSITWNHKYNSTYTYDNQGRLLERLVVTVATQYSPSQNESKQIYFYDIKGNETGWHYYKWDRINLIWDLRSGYKYTNNYDSSGQLIESYYQYAGYPFSSKTTFTYNPDGTLAESIYYGTPSGGWIPNTKSTLTYSNGQHTSTLTQQYQNNVWVNKYRNINYVWHTINDKPTSYINQQYINGIWENRFKLTNSYGQNGDYISKDERWQNGNWTNAYLDTLNFDNYLNEIKRTHHIWNTTTNEWRISTETRKTIYTYSPNNDLLDKTKGWYDQWTQGILFTKKEVYSNFQYFTITGQPEESTQLKVEVYPNPTSDFLTIQLPETKNQTFTATLTDVTGKKVLSQQFVSNSGTEQINLTALSAGIYILQLRSTDNFKIVKIIKQ